MVNVALPPQASSRSAPTIAQPAMSRMPKEPEKPPESCEPAPAPPGGTGAPHAGEFVPCPCEAPQRARAMLAETPKEPKSRSNPGEFARWRDCPAPGARSATIHPHSVRNGKARTTEGTQEPQKSR
jgi:hypothetical protein